MNRPLEFLFAAALLILLAPVFLLLALWVVVVSPGPVFFVQERIGRDMKPFRIYKLRTMRPHSEHEIAGGVTVANDPRLIRGAAFLRKFKFDELPQLFNVLNGSMSFVGPRPTVDSDCARMDERQRRRFRVRPGITGLAQIRGGTAMNWPQRIELDLEYVEQRSLFTDLKICWLTLWLVVAGAAESHPTGDDEWGEPPVEQD